MFINITQGSALIGLAAELGANDFTFGILIAIPFFGTLIQIPAAMIVNKSGKRKKFLLTYGLAARVMWILVGIVPYFIPMEPEWLTLWAIIFLVGISSVGGSFINVCFTPWLTDLLHIRIRGRWLATRDKIASVLGVAVGVATALVLDNVPGMTGYAIVFIVGGSLGVLDMLMYAGIKESQMIQSATQSVISVLKQIYRDKVFFRFMVFWTAWAFSANFGGAFIGRYALGPLNLSFLEVTLAGQVTAALITVAVISKWGRTIDHYGSKPVFTITCTVQAFIPLILLFARPDQVITFFLVNFIGAAFWSASNLACINMQMTCSPDEGRPAYIAVFTCITSLLGAFLGVFLGGAFLEWVPGFMEQVNFTINNSPPDRYKVIFVVSVCVRLITVIVFLPRIQNEKDSNIRELGRDFVDYFKMYSPRKIYRAIRGRR